MEQVPSDFEIEYQWCEGSVPPPHHYEYRIHLTPDGQVRIFFCPDYPGDAVPVWKAGSWIGPGGQARIYRMLLGTGVLSGWWRTNYSPTIGGCQEGLKAVSNGRTVQVPSNVVRTPELDDLYAAIRALIPPAVWDDLFERRESYIALPRWAINEVSIDS